MPNWCSNTLTISGDAKQIKEFKEISEVKGKEKTDLSFNKTVPIPSIINQEATISPSKDKPNKLLKKLLGADNWYDWSVKNWGTKWDANNAELTMDNDEYLEYIFETAWNPPVEWLEKVSKKFPKLEFRMKYEEEGMGFLGIAKGSNGNIEDKCID
jgi:hypothetical protein